jgi:hypothetical protein
MIEPRYEFFGKYFWTIAIPQAGGFYWARNKHDERPTLVWVLVNSNGTGLLYYEIPEKGEIARREPQYWSEWTPTIRPRDKGVWSLCLLPGDRESHHGDRCNPGHRESIAAESVEPHAVRSADGISEVGMDWRRCVEQHQRQSQDQNKQIQAQIQSILESAALDPKSPYIAVPGAVSSPWSTSGTVIDATPKPYRDMAMNFNWLRPGALRYAAKRYPDLWAKIVALNPRYATSGQFSAAR